MTKKEAAREYKIKIYQARGSVVRLKSVRGEIARDGVLSKTGKELLMSFIDEKIDSFIDVYFASSIDVRATLA